MIECIVGIVVFIGFPLLFCWIMGGPMPALPKSEKQGRTNANFGDEIPLFLLTDFNNDAPDDNSDCDCGDGGDCGGD